MKKIKKILNVVLVFILLYTMFVASVFVKPLEAKASGATALKNAVIYTMESAGIKFSTQEAKDKAYDAWNMKAYEKWQSDEASGKNQDLWNQFNSVKQDLASQNILEDPDMPGFAKLALDWTFVGMAVAIGAEIGYQIQDANENNTMMKYLSMNGQPEFAGISYNVALGLSLVKDGNIFYLYLQNGKWLLWEQLAFSSSLKGDEYLHVTGYSVSMKNGLPYLDYSYQYGYWSSGKWTVKNNSGSKSLATLGLTENEIINGLEVPYEAVPKIEEVPEINPAPSVSPLVVPNPSIEEVPLLIPQTQPRPLEIIVPIEPTDPNPYIKPLELPEPGTNPDPDTDPDTDPNKPNIPTPGIDKPPYERPDSDPRPGTDPDTNPGTEPTPEYPEKTETTETPGLFEKLWEWLKAILDVLFKILAAIIALPFQLLELLWDFLFDIAKALFIPSDGFWDDNMTELKKVIWSDEMDNMIDGFESLGSGGGGFFKDIVVSLMGVDGLIVIDADSINSILENIHSWVRGVIYPLLILFNVNSMYKLIRGVSLVEATRGLANRSKGGE